MRARRFMSTRGIFQRGPVGIDEHLDGRRVTGEADSFVLCEDGRSANASGAAVPVERLPVAGSDRTLGIRGASAAAQANSKSRWLRAPATNPHYVRLGRVGGLVGSSPEAFGFGSRRQFPPPATTCMWTGLR